MKHIRMAGLAIALTLGTASVSLAQQPAKQHQVERGQRGPRGGGMKALLKDIKLTDAQKDQLKQLREKDREQFQGQRQRNERPDTAEFRVRQQERYSQIRSILTADQQKQFDKNVAEVQKKFAERRGKHHKQGA